VISRWISKELANNGGPPDFRKLPRIRLIVGSTGAMWRVLLLAKVKQQTPKATKLRRLSAEARAKEKPTGYGPGGFVSLCVRSCITQTHIHDGDSGYEKLTTR
jgi:hypothetical protein